MSTTIAVIGALDTKGDEFAFVRDEIERRGHRTLVIDSGVISDPGFEPDVSAAEVAAAGGTSLAELRAQGDRGTAIGVMARGGAAIVRRLHAEGRIDGVLSMGGSAGTAVGTAAMRALPVGVPKIMVSTVASGDTSGYVDTKDVVMVPSIVDVAGVNRISARIYANAVGAVTGMVETSAPEIEDKPLIAASMFGNTTPAVERCRERLDALGYEVLVFHATGTGGRTMEDVIAGGFASGVLDEWADELVGGVMAAGPARMDAAAAQGVPQVIAPGCLDMVNFQAPSTIPDRFEGRRFHYWNPNVSLMRTDPAENAELGRILAEKANASSAPTAIFLPLKGLSLLGAPGEEFHWPEADQALFDAIKQHVRDDIPVHELDLNVNDEAFADAMTDKLLEYLG